MKTIITPYLLRFAFVITILTIIFRFCLSYGIENKMTTIIVLTAILYFVSMFISGWIFGKKDVEFLPIFDVGFRFHLTTYIIHNLVSELWFIAGFNSPKENISVIHQTALYWAIFLLLHFIYYMWARKNSINGLNKDELFD